LDIDQSARIDLRAICAKELAYVDGTVDCPFPIAREKNVAICS
jgi:hypothetical protein